MFIFKYVFVWVLPSFGDKSVKLGKSSSLVFSLFPSIAALLSDKMLQLGFSYGPPRVRDHPRREKNIHPYIP